MKNDKPQKDQIFDAVIQIEDPIQRAKKLEDLCGNDALLKDEILDLVARDAQMESFLEKPPTAVFADDETADNALASAAPSIPNYRFLKVIGRGGMGTVWLVEQEEPVRRQVALKLIRSDVSGSQIIARFEAERQALAMMDHPNIAKVLEAGTTVNGAPFFVMELVNGIPMNRYCDEHQLNIHDRLNLFVEVCKAVSHAHQKGIIHRDLKPSNILVENIEGQATAKVIDFGLAKAIAPELNLTDESVHTEFGRVVGTIQYMSPEQADSQSKDIDTRSDIYSLGVILFELLTGSTPIPKEIVVRSNLLELLQKLRDNKITIRPSERIETGEKSTNNLDISRRIAPAKLHQILRGELDWIVMKALEWERSRRYETVNALSDDILRFVNHEPVQARPPSTGYRLQKFVQKNRGLVTAASAIFVLLVAGTVGTSVGFYRASRNAKAERKAKDIAVEQKQLADNKSREAKIAAEESKASAKRSSDALDIFSNAFQSVNPDSWKNPDMNAVDVLDKAKEALDSSELDDEGRVVLLQALSRSYDALAEYKPAVENVKRAG